VVSTQAVVPPPEVTTEEAPVERETKSKSGVALAGKIGTLGGGAELNLGIFENVNARLGFNGFKYKYNANSASVNYDFTMELLTVSAIADWYPFSGGFRTSGGVLFNNNSFSLAGKPTGSTYTIGNTTYLAGDISSLQATMTFNKIAPYLGIGWGNPVAADKGWGLVSDVGVVFQGAPRIDLLASCVTNCATFQADADAERVKLQNDLSKFKWWPVISVGISYQW
jgi:hypothetical protein